MPQHRDPIHSPHDLDQQSGCYIAPLLVPTFALSGLVSSISAQVPLFKKNVMQRNFLADLESPPWVRPRLLLGATVAESVCEPCSVDGGRVAERVYDTTNQDHPDGLTT